ncbi:MAG: PadR family transcriptional regulator [Anaerolineaceae bacterium]|nr:PadR family transcriptional regulator [Anaerolineaceae bacterium]
MFNNRRDSFGNWFGQGFNPRGFGPRFERGEIRFVILDLLKDKPRHGYSIIQELEKKSHGFYTPSSGTIYPTLQLLEDQDLITSDQKEGKKVFTITEQGLKYLKENQAELEQMQERIRGPWGAHNELMNEMREGMGQLARFVFSQNSEGKLSPEKKEKLRAAFNKFREEVEKIISEA